MTRRKVAPAPDGDATRFEAVLADFKARFPEAWDQCRLWPTESGLLHIVARLKG